MTTTAVPAEAVLPLDRAMLCPDCDLVCGRRYRACPACGRDQLVPLATWLGSVQFTSRSPSGRYPTLSGFAAKVDSAPS